MRRRQPRKPPSPQRLPFCPVCGLWPHLCVCSELPKIAASCSFLVIQHFSEAQRQSNTGRLTATLLAESTVVPWGWPDLPFDESALAAANTDYLVLFPRPGARELCADLDGVDASRRLRIVLLDATWAQAKSMARRIPGLSGLAFAVLPPGRPPSWELRRSPDKSSYSTLEAAIRAVEVIDGEPRAGPLRAVMERVQARGLFLRGKIRRDELERRERQATRLERSEDLGSTCAISRAPRPSGNGEGRT